MNGKKMSVKERQQKICVLLSNPTLLKIILGCLKTSSGFPVIFYGKTQMKFLANSILQKEELTKYFPIWMEAGYGRQ